MSTKTSRRRGEYYIVSRIHHQPLHVHLWRQADARRRVRIHIAELAEWLGVSYDLANEQLIVMRNDGRLRRVRYTSEGPVGIYEIADPFRWDPNDSSTHARKHSSPQWG